MYHLSFKRFIRINTVLVFTLQQISPAFAMEPLEIKEKISKTRLIEKKTSSPVSDRKRTEEEKEKETIIQKLLSHNVLSIDEEKKFKAISKELMTDLLSIKEAFRENTGTLILLIGKTGSGKTTLAEWLSGEKLRTVQDKHNKKKFIFESESDRIKGGALSKTSCPILYPIDDNETHCADCPGLEDTRGILQDTKNTVYIRELFRHHNAVKFLIAEPASFFQEDIGRGTHFREVLYSLKAMFSDSYFNNNALQDSISLVITHYNHHNPAHKDLEDLQEWITDELVKDEKDEVIRNILTSFSQPNKIAFFSQPEGEQNPFQNDAEKEKILFNIQQTLPLFVSFETDIKSSFSYDSRALLSLILNELKIDLSSFLREMIEKELKPSVENKILNYKQSVDLAVSTGMLSYSIISNVFQETKKQLVGEDLQSMPYTIFKNFVQDPIVSLLYVGTSYRTAFVGGWQFTAISSILIGLLSTYKKRANYEKEQWSENKASKGAMLNSEFNGFSEKLEKARTDICGESLFGEQGVLNKIKSDTNISEIDKNIKLMDYLLFLTGSKAESSEEIWHQVFHNFTAELIQYCKKDGQDLYKTAEGLLKKKEIATTILIEEVQKEAPHISEKFVRAVVKNLDEASPHENINVTGSPLSQKKLGKLIKYMDLCTHIYTDPSTRSIADRHDHFIEEKWNEIIRNKKEIDELYEKISALRKEYSEIQPSIYEAKGTKNSHSKQVPTLSIEAQTPHFQARYIGYIEDINIFLQGINRKPIEHKELKDLPLTIQELGKVQQNINSEYFFYFSKNPKNTISTFIDTKEKKHQLTNQAIVAASFLLKAQLAHHENITILDVGFRNLGTIKSFLQKMLGTALTFKDNPIAWFEGWGEVDYVAYLEQDNTPKGKDKLVITYSGSNSLLDWITDFTIGHTTLLDLSVHEGIGKMFRESTSYCHSLLINKIKNYYDYHRRPNKFEIITTGHSLGGGLALFAAYYYKEKKQNYLQKIIGPDKVISVKTFVFGSPAIVDKESQKIMERTLGKKNISRVWNFDDLVVYGTDNAWFQRDMHIGRSFPLHNIGNLSFNFSDKIMGPHGMERYQCYLHALGKQSLHHERLTSILKNYVKNLHAHEEQGFASSFTSPRKEIQTSFCVDNFASKTKYSLQKLSEKSFATTTTSTTSTTTTISTYSSQLDTVHSQSTIHQDQDI